MAQQTIQTKTIDDVPPMRRFCEHPEHPRSERVPPVAAFIISLTSRNAALRGGLYVCAEHAAVNQRFVVSRIVAAEPVTRENEPSYRLPCDGDCLDNELEPGSCPGWRLDHERIARENLEH